MNRIDNEINGGKTEHTFTATATSCYNVNEIDTATSC